MSAYHQLFTLLLLLSSISAVLLQSAYRLPIIIQPVDYRLHLNLTEVVFTEASNEYHGMVIINFTTTEVTTNIQLHAHHEFIRINLVTIGNTDVNESAYAVDNVTDILSITTPFQISPNFYYPLIIDFTGQLSTTEMTGFYKSSYINPLGATRYLATTQFQPTSARRAFPCFDEPSFKATFEIYLTYPLGLNALSNTPGAFYINDSVSETMRFDLTAVMSTYLIAFVISDFTCSEGLIDTVPYQVCSRAEMESTREWALEIGPGLLTSLNNFTQFAYNRSKDKLDQVAIPDFAAGAMENWGLVTYRELFLLWDPIETSNLYKQLIAIINSHEFAHFWFGNLVTCNWWSETFLNEGFATYFEYFTTHDVLPEWQLDKQFIVDVLQPILVNDALENALALQSEASSPAEVMAKFGRISYSKGASVFRMVEHIIGSENFRTGLRNYIDLHQYGTVLPEDLWASLNAVTDNSTAKLPASSLGVVLENWVKNPGFPLLTVTKIGASVTISQERFLISGSDDTSKWYVPISYTTATDLNKFNNTTPEEWLTPEGDLEFTLHWPAPWIILNNQVTGFYRVNYDYNTWNNIRDDLLQENFGEIPEIHRAQIVDDLFNLARANRIAYSRVFNIIRFLASDTSYFTWSPTIAGFNFLLARVGLHTPLGQAISIHVLELMEQLYSSVSFVRHDEDDQIYSFKQVLTFSSACRLGHVICISSSKLLFGLYKFEGFRLNKNLRSIVYCNGLRHSTDQNDWEFLWGEYRNSTLASEQATILTSLGCSQDVELLERYLNYSITEGSGIRSQDALSVFTSVYNGNPIGVDVAFRFLRENHQLISEKYLSMNALPNLINGLAGVFTTQEQVNQLREFIETGGLPEEYHPSATTALEAAQANLLWLEHFLDDLHAYYFTEEEEEDVETTVTTTIAPTTPGSAGTFKMHVSSLILAYVLSKFF